MVLAARGDGGGGHPSSPADQLAAITGRIPSGVGGVPQRRAGPDISCAATRLTRIGPGLEAGPAGYGGYQAVDAARDAATLDPAERGRGVEPVAVGT